MEKILITFIISIITGIVSTLLGVAISLRTFTALFFGCLASDIVLLSVYFSDIVGTQGNPDLVYIFFYILGTIVIITASGLYTLIRSNSSRCVCRCCRNYDYEEIFK